MARKSTPQPPSAPPRLVQSRNRAREALVARIELGLSLREQDLESPTDLEAAKNAEDKWQEYNFELIRRLFTTDEYAAAYRNAQYGGAMVMMYREKYFHEELDDFKKDVQSQISYLESLAGRLDLIEEDAAVGDILPQEKTPRTASQGPPRVFIVHGHDEEVKAIVARFIERCALKPIILHEQADQGRTIIEKFEDSSDVAFAIVLLTPDDVGGLKPPANEDPFLQVRARQNVIMELGFFVGALGRSKVMALKKGDLELPSDYAGVIYTPFDAADGWKLSLARELKAAGIQVDMNAALS